jgi:hypothetical protein
MTLAGTLEALCVAADALADAFSAARVTVCEDQPPGVPSHVVDKLAEAMIELEGDTTALRDHIRSVVLGSTPPTREQALALISLAQRTLHDISDGVASRVGSAERAEIVGVVRRSGGQWPGWWVATVRGLAECDPSLRDLRDALFACWRELAELNTRRPLDDVDSGRRSRLPAADSAVVVAAHGQLSGRVALRTVAEEPGGGPEG